MVIELSKNYPDKKRFEAWLKAQGHEIDRGLSVRTYVDLDDISTNPEAMKTFRKLERQFREAT